jgi:hypothetical protein
MRSIEPKMVKYLDEKLAGNGLAQKAIKDKDARALMLMAAQACVGIREQGGNNKGPMVQLIQETIGSAVAEAWCMAFVQTCVAYAEVKTGKKSPLYPSEHCMSVWLKTPKSARVKVKPLRGAIAIWNYPPGQSGHTGILDAYDDARKGKMNLIEGNTEKGLSKKGLIERDGGGVYYTERANVGSPKMKLIGYLKPF